MSRYKDEEKRDFPGDKAFREKTVDPEVKQALDRRDRQRKKLERRTIKDVISDVIGSSRR